VGALWSRGTGAAKNNEKKNTNGEENSQNIMPTEGHKL